MTAKQLERYPYLKAKVKRLQDKITDLQGEFSVCGSIEASRHSEPYDKIEQIIGSADASRDVHFEILEKRSELECAVADVQEIEQFIGDIEDVKLQEIFTYRYLYGEKWHEVAAHFGYSESEDSVRMKAKRYLESCS